MSAPPGRQRSRRRGGFSLVETVLALGLAATVMAMSLPFLHTARRLWERAERQREARRALDGAVGWIARDLRQAGYRVPGPPLREAGEGRLAYTLSRGGADAAVGDPAARRLVTVFTGDGDLKYRVQAAEPPPGSGWAAGATQVIAPGVAALRCAAVAGDGAPTADPAAAALVTCVLAAASGEERRFSLRLRAPGGGAP